MVCRFKREKGVNLLKIDFKSKELDRTFDEVIFSGGVHADRESVGIPISMPTSHNSKAAKGSSAKERLDLQIEPVEGGLTISELLSTIFRQADMMANSCALENRICHFYFL